MIYSQGHINSLKIKNEKLQKAEQVGSLLHSHLQLCLTSMRGVESKLIRYCPLRCALFQQLLNVTNM